MRRPDVSARLYHRLLRLYPAGFRNAYSAELVAAFREQRREPRYARAALGSLLFWTDILADLTATATRQHLASDAIPGPRIPRRRESFMGTLTQEITYALRALRRNKGVTVAALLTLAIGIGANTAMFSLVDGVLLRPFPYPDPERLAFVWDSHPVRGWDTFTVSPPNFLDYRDQTDAFEAMTAYYAGTMTLSGGDEPERLRSVNVASDFFQTFGIEPQIGRAFSPEDNEPGNTDIAILSDRLWARRFASDPGVLGGRSPWTALP